MKKLIALVAVCGFAVAFVACGGKKTEEASTVDSAAVETPAVTPAPADSAAADSTATTTPVDSAAHH